MSQQFLVSKKYQDLVPSLSSDEYDQLRQSIHENGLWIPIVTNDKKIILDGHHDSKSVRIWELPYLTLPRPLVVSCRRKFLS